MTDLLTVVMMENLLVGQSADLLVEMMDLMLAVMMVVMMVVMTDMMLDV
jgi:hypothetical protein